MAGRMLVPISYGYSCLSKPGATLYIAGGGASGVGEWNAGALLLVDGLGRLQFGNFIGRFRSTHRHVQAYNLGFDCARVQVFLAMHVRVRFNFG